MSHTAAEFSIALQALLPVGAAWQWSPEGFGNELLLDTAQELARVDAATVLVLQAAIDLHRPGSSSFMLADYQQVADDNTQVIPRKPATIGSKVGYRLWSIDAPESVSPAPVVTLFTDLTPCVAGNKIGDQLWSSRARYYLRAEFDKSLINSNVLRDALLLFKQAHVCLYFADVPNLGD